ncbi:probable serine/threonine-protein kinase dyrk1 [Trachinotus anak]|uniref:probable serine/threonine-protein kinase dyrk1 n=1 Tax=Trachinotus anak TaxID=443729 RepID=UPI0039F25715
MSSTTSTSTSNGTNEKDKEKAPAPYQVQKEDVLHSNTTNYLVLDFNGEGCFGKVAKCLDLITGKTVAIKIHKKSEEHIIQREVDMLEAVRALDPDKKNIVRFMDHFRFHDLSCLAFEMLDRSLWDLMKERKFKSLTLSEIRPVTHQLMVAFEALKNIGIIHTDLKPDNIMLVNHNNQQFKIKLIDFGLALPVSQVEDGMIIQPRAYRAPEVNFGLRFSEAVDMWGVGCVMAFTYFGINLFPGNCAYNWMKAMVHLLGQPEDHQLIAGKNTWMFFKLETDKGWRLRTPEEYKEATGVRSHVSRRFFDLARNLEDAVQRCPAKQDDLEYEDRMAFLSLLKNCLHLDAEQRISPRKALKHRFLTMVHLVDEMETSSYADNALQFMNVSPLHHLDESDDSFINTETSYDSGYKGSDPVAYRHDCSDSALTNNFQKEPSTASSNEKDSLTDSFGGEDADPENSNAEDADIESSSCENAQRESDKYCDSESSIGGDSNNESSSGNDADAETSIEDGELPAISVSNDGDSSDEDSFTPHSSGECVIVPVSSDSTDQSSFSLNFSDNDDIKPTKPCFYFDKVLAPTGLESESAISCSREEDSLLENPSDQPPYTNKSIHDNSTGPSAVTHFNDGARDVAASTKDESGTAGTLSDDNTNTDCLPLAAISSDDRAAAAISSDDRAAAAIPSDDRAVASISSEDRAAAAIPSDDRAAAAISSDDRAAASISSDDRAAAAISSDDRAAASISSDDRAVAAISSDDRAAAAISSDDRAVASISSEDRAAASIPSKDGAAVSIFSKDRTTATIRPTDAGDIKTGPGGARRKNLLQRTGKFFRRLKERMVSIFKCQCITAQEDVPGPAG